MEDKSGIFKEYEHNFKLTEAHVRKMYSILSEYAEKVGETAYVSIFAGRENDSYIQTVDLEKVLEEENISGKSIRSLRMEIFTKTEQEGESLDGLKAAVVFSKNKQTKITLIANYSDRDWCFLIADELDTQVQRIIINKPLSIKFYQMLNILFAILMIFLPLLLFGFFIELPKENLVPLEELLAQSLETKLDYLVENKFNTLSTIDFVPVALGATLSMMMFFFVIELKPIVKFGKITNTSVFYWGDIISAYDLQVSMRSKIKWGVIIAFVVSLAATLVGALFV